MSHLCSVLYHLSQKKKKKVELGKDQRTAIRTFKVLEEFLLCEQLELRALTWKRDVG